MVIKRVQECHTYSQRCNGRDAKSCNEVIKDSIEFRLGCPYFQNVQKLLFQLQHDRTSMHLILEEDERCGTLVIVDILGHFEIDIFR